MKLKKYLIFALACFMIVSLLAMGCTPARRPLTDNDNTIGTPDGDQGLGTGDYNGINGDGPNGNRINGTGLNGTGLNGNGPYTNDDNNTIYPAGEADMTMDQQMEDQIKNDVEKISGVDNAIVIVNGNTAYVGIDAQGNINDTRTNDLKDQVIEKVRGRNGVTRVYVSADIDITDRLRGYGEEVRAGRPITGFIDEIEEMFRRPIPKS